MMMMMMMIFTACVFTSAQDLFPIMNNSAISSGSVVALRSGNKTRWERKRKKTKIQMERLNGRVVWILEDGNSS